MTIGESLGMLTFTVYGQIRKRGKWFEIRTVRAFTPNQAKGKIESSGADRWYHVNSATGMPFGDCQQYKRLRSKVHKGACDCATCGRAKSSGNAN